jgi:hypothetical protein
MLWVLAGIEVVLWIYGMATHHRMGGVLHFLLLLAAIAVLTELGLRFRRDWQVRHRVAEHRPVSEHRKAA